MRRFPNTTPKKTRIEIIPMIDVMMFLLIFFVLLSINVIPSLGLKMDLPSSSTVNDNKPIEKLIINLSSDSIIQVNGETFENLEGVKTEVAKLKNIADQENKQLTVFINGDKAAQLQPLVDVIDVLKTLQVNAIVITAKKKQ